MLSDRPIPLHLRLWRVRNHASAREVGRKPAPEDKRRCFMDMYVVALIGTENYRFMIHLRHSDCIL